MKRYRVALESWHRDYFTSVLVECGNNISEVARVTGLNRTHLYIMLKRYGIERAHTKPGKKSLSNEGNQAWRELR